MINHAELLAQVANLYYEENLTQDEIAHRIGTSRSTVSRLLHEARAAGVVEIIIHYPWKTMSELEQELTGRFHLRHARVLAGQGRPYPEILRGLGVLAARYLESVLQESSILGISWGTAVHSTVQALRPERKLPITVVQMIGAVGTGDPLIDGPDLARLLANIYGGECRYLHAPLVVEDAQVQEMLLQEPRIRETLSLACQADVALVGIGSTVPEVSSLLRAGYLDLETLMQLRAQGAVGDVCARHYDAQGRLLDIELNQRIVGIELEALHHIEQVIGVAGGEAKAEAILGALRGGHVNVLVTDDVAAKRVLALESSNR
ncbi:MAG: sugar-binding transcriptional regulator [Anaerolineae bacterium]|jgi:DNA-binding transcriptional regulator LsrR (DeoR family)|nr:sugar-binding transcriptional regulator [Anaerolineae bacterium]MDH7474446.1 sugar-binding transcriptional regulator [Anaerolineae bacterium]